MLLSSQKTHYEWNNLMRNQAFRLGFIQNPALVKNDLAKIKTFFYFKNPSLWKTRSKQVKNEIEREIF